MLFLIQQKTYQNILRQAEAAIFLQKAQLEYAQTQLKRYTDLLPQKAAAQTLVLMENLAAKALPGGMGYQWTATSYQKKGVDNQAYFIYAISVTLVFVVLAALYESWTSPAAVILAVPMALVGVLLAATLAIVAVTIVFPFTPVGEVFGFVGLPMRYLFLTGLIVFCLFSQAGVAIGLAIFASHRFPYETAKSIILVVTATTFLVQIIGPPSVRFAVIRADEVGKDEGGGHDGYG